MKKSSFIGYRGRELNLVEYDDVKNPVGIIIVAHGMQEHAGRYEWFLTSMQEKGYKGYIMDLRGHGENRIDGRDGHDEGDIFLNIVEDYKMLIAIIKAKNPKLPIIMFGHSYGSFITQRLIVECDNLVDRFIVCGSRFLGGADFKFGKMISKITKLFKGNDAKPKMIENVMFGGFKKKFKKEDGNWLSRDPEVWDKYLVDELCGNSFPVSFYKSLFTSAPKSYKNLAVVDESTPILLIVGDNDPVSNGGKSVKKLYKLYTKHWLNVQLKVYEGARHELLNETNKDEVLKDIIKFIEKAPKQAKHRK